MPRDLPTGLSPGRDRPRASGLAHECNVPKRHCGHSKAVCRALLSPEGVYPHQELLLLVPSTPQSPKSHLPVSYLIPPSTSYMIPPGTAAAGAKGDPAEQSPGPKRCREV